MAGTSHLTRGFTSVSLSACYHSRTRTLSHLPTISILSNHTPKRTTRSIVHGSRRLGPTRSIVHGSRKLGPIKNSSMDASFGSPLEESVKTTISDNPVVLYSKTWCSYSSEVKSLFKRLGVQPLVVELDQLGPQGPQLQKVLESLTGQQTVPNVFIGGKHIGGCTDTIKLHQSGELEPLLSEAGARKAES